MAKFMLHWEVVEARMPEDPKTIAGSWNMMLEYVKQDFEKGVLKDWGTYPGQRAGYSICEGTETDVMRMTMQYAPYVRFEIRPIAGIREVSDFLREVS